MNIIHFIRQLCLISIVLLLKSNFLFSQTILPDDINSTSTNSTFLMIHFEVGAYNYPWYKQIAPTGDNRNLQYQAALWPTAVNMINIANEHGFKLTLALTPQWAEYILQDLTKIQTVKAWQENGHEIGFHHHGYDNPDWDGFSNRVDANIINDRRYRGNVNEGFEFVKNLAAPYSVRTLTATDIPLDFPDGNFTQTYGGGADSERLEFALTEPYIKMNKNNTIYFIGHGLMESYWQNNAKSLEYLEALKNIYKSMTTPRKALGVVLHVYDFYRFPVTFIEWMDFLDSKNNKSKTVDNIINDYKKIQNSPFALHEARFFDPNEPAAMLDLNTKWARLAPQKNLHWDTNEPLRGIYDWNATDILLLEANNKGIYTFVTVSAKREHGPGRYPDDIEWFLDYLGKAVERYDGDGIDDAPGSPKIDVLQIENEVDGAHFWTDTPENYALLLKKSYQTIKKHAPDMKVSIAGVATPEGYYRFYVPVLTELNRLKDNTHDIFFDIFDFHWSAQFLNENDYAAIQFLSGTYSLTNTVSDIKAELKKIDHNSAELYITEMSDYSDSPAGYAYHTEKYHAVAVVKRYVHAIANQVDKIFWCQIVEQHNFGGEANGYFDNVGLINNPANDDKSHKKLAYYTYKKMVETLEGSDWNKTEIIYENDSINIYKFINNLKPLWVVWSDEQFQCITTPCGIQITLSGISAKKVKITEAVPFYESGLQVKDYSAAFKTEIKDVIDGKIDIIVWDVPLFISEI